MVKGYLTTKDLCSRYRKSARTIARWENREDNPLPPPRFRNSGTNNLWAIDDIEAWEERVAQQSAA